MTSFIASCKKNIQNRHYVRKVRQGNYWYDFMAKKMQNYIRKFGDDFCLILYASSKIDDAYVIPFAHAKSIFTKDLIDDRGRWTGTIKGGEIGVYYSPNTPNYMNVSQFHNAYELLGDIDS